MNLSAIPRLLFLLPLVACAPTTVQKSFERPEAGRRPERILVYDLAVSTAASTGLAVVSEKLSADVEAEAHRTAKSIASELHAYFARQGWVAPR